MRRTFRRLLRSLVAFGGTATALAAQAPTTEPTTSGTAPANFRASVDGMGRVTFRWSVVPGVAGIVVYDARTGVQRSPLVRDSAWTSAPLAPGSYTFVAAPWRAAGARMPAATSERSAPVVVTVPRR